MTERVDQEVVRRFAAGDDAAFSEIYRAYSGPMFSIALRTLGRRDTAADAVQQAFVQAWKAAASFAPEADVVPWLFTITRRTAIDLWRKERRDVLTDDDGVFDEPTPGPSLESAWEAWEVRRALDALPDDEREVVRLHYLDGLTQTETASRLGVPVGTVKSRSHRAHRRLAHLLSHVAGTASTADSVGSQGVADSVGSQGVADSVGSQGVADSVGRQRVADSAGGRIEGARR